MRYHVLDIASTVDFISRRRPVLEAILRRFQPLLEQRKAVAQELAEKFQELGLALPQFQRERSLAGVPLLAAQELDPLLPWLRVSAEKMLPTLLELPPLAKSGEALKKVFLEDERNSQKLFEAMLAGDDTEIMAISRNLDAAPEVLLFAGEFILSPVLRGLVTQQQDEEGGFPWDEEGIWNQGYCPVCGDSPALAWLDRPKLEDKNTFLVGGGGKKNYHCSLCDSSWKFRRGLCPACGKEGNNVMEIIQESGAHGERVDYCTKCKSYCPTVDLREFGDVPDMDVMALGMLHMDMAAAQKKLHPTKPAFWNVF